MPHPGNAPATHADVATRDWLSMTGLSGQQATPTLYSGAAPATRPICYAGAFCLTSSAFSALTGFSRFNTSISCLWMSGS